MNCIQRAGTAGGHAVEKLNDSLVENGECTLEFSK